MGNTVGRQFCVSQFQKEVIIGSLLGDARLECRSKEYTARLRIHQGDEQKEFAFWKYKILKNLVSISPKRIICCHNPKTKQPFYSWYFHTLTFKEFGGLYRDFYSVKRKILPKNISKMLTPLGLAVWIMDDGCHDKGAMIINSHNFSLNENKKLQDVLKSNFNLVAKINKDRARFRLRIRKKDFLKLKKIIIPYIIPSMRYKIVPVTTS